MAHHEPWQRHQDRARSRPSRIAAPDAGRDTCISIVDNIPEVSSKTGQNRQPLGWMLSTPMRSHHEKATGKTRRFSSVNTSVNRRTSIGEGRIELHVAGCEIELFDEIARFSSAEFALHATVFPFDRKRPLIADDVQCPDDLFEIHAAATG